jgi:ABC-type polysaccharide transport system permease subunit
MSGRFKNTINIIALFVIIGFAVSVYFLSRFHDARSTKKEETIYLPKFAPEFLKDIAREEYILVEIEPNDPRISKEWIKEHINQQEF